MPTDRLPAACGRRAIDRVEAGGPGLLEQKTSPGAITARARELPAGPGTSTPD